MSDKNRGWDAKNFLSTLAFFGEIPFLGSFRWVQQWLGQSPKIPGMTITAPIPKVAMLSAAEPAWISNLQQRLPSVTFQLYQGNEVEQLLALPKDGPSHAADALATVDTVVVLPDLAVSTQKSAIAATAKTAQHALSNAVFDFTQPDFDISPWGSLDDVVMGGVSQGRFALSKKTTEPKTTEPKTTEPKTTEQTAIFSGVISTDNSGGFSSVRTRNFEPPFNFSGWTGMQLRVKGDGQRYKFILRNSGGWDSPAYIYSFDTVADEWITVTVPFAEMVATFRAKSVSNAPDFDPSQVFSLQLMLSKFEYDRRLNPHFSPGAFSLAISSLDVFRPRQGVPLVIVGADSEATKGEQQLALTDAQLAYRLIETGNGAGDGTLLDSLVEALT
ncbi:MAG: CIA30 family protein [Cyanobacteria bacterium J06643_4]